MRDMPGDINCVVLLGPTASGKTGLAVRLARKFGWEIISADSRQVYKGLDIVSGKDLGEYFVDGQDIPHHLIDITTLDREYNVFCFQNDFYRLFEAMRAEGKMPFIVGGTGLYIESVILDYKLLPVPENKEQKARLNAMTQDELASLLIKLRPALHNKSDLLIKERTIKAIQIEAYKRTPERARAEAALASHPKVEPLVMGIKLEREDLYRNIEARLASRIRSGMIDEVRELHKTYSWETLEKLGLEARYVSFYLEGKISSVNDMEALLCTEIKHFAKRQETWFRRMERRGVKIHWLSSGPSSPDALFNEACALIEQGLGSGHSPSPADA